MRYDDPQLQDALAADYAVGQLRGAARRRLVALMRERPELRERVAAWEQDLLPLAAKAPPETPPPRVWRAVRARIGAPRRSVARRWWTAFAAGAAAAALAALAVVALLPPPPGGAALLHDARAEPAIVVSWAAARELQVTVVGHPEMAPDTAWQAWAIGPRAAPVPLGLIGVEPRQRLALSDAAARALTEARAIGVSVEPKGGSTGAPSLPYLFQGAVLRPAE